VGTVGFEAVEELGFDALLIFGSVVGEVQRPKVDCFLRMGNVSVRLEAE
jgi:hypothetical protein